MQSVKFVMREIGAPGGGRIPVEEFEQYLEYNYLSNGYTLFGEHKDSIYEDGLFKGYRVMLTLVKDEEVKPAKK